MSAGRPYNSTTPLWRSKPAVKVAIYHFLCFHDHKEPTKYGCAKEMGISRTTTTKWFEATRWDEKRQQQYWTVRRWVIEHLYTDSCDDAKQCSSELMLQHDDVCLFMQIFKIESQYIIF